MAKRCPDFMVPPGTPASPTTSSMSIHDRMFCKVSEFLRSFTNSSHDNDTRRYLLNLFGGEPGVQHDTSGDQSEVLRLFLQLHHEAKRLPHHMVDSDIATVNTFIKTNRTRKILDSRMLNLKFEIPKFNSRDFMEKAELMKKRPTDFMLSFIKLIHKLKASRPFRYEPAQRLLEDVLSQVLSNELESRKRLDAKLFVPGLKWLTLSGKPGVPQYQIANDDTVDFCKKEQYELMQVVHHAISTILLRLMGPYFAVWYQWTFQERPPNSHTPNSDAGEIPRIPEIVALDNISNC